MTDFLYHFHGLGTYDFSSLRPQDLPSVQKLAVEYDVEILPTVYLRRSDLPAMAATIRAYHDLREAGLVPNIAGFAVEGPLLGPAGGIPRAGRWVPGGAEWHALAELAPLGLKYIVMAPDAMELDEEIEPGLTFADVLVDFYDHGLRVALGHFHRDYPERSARRMRDVIEFLHGRYESSPYLVLTDHLFNDMPRAFTHAWRTPADRKRRAAELAPVIENPWSDSDLPELLGPVPAAMLAAAQEGLLTPCINFDGYHVDLEICRMTFELLGEDRLITLTDHTEVPVMALEQLSRDPDSGLWMRDDGAVAAGTTDHRQQRRHMSSIGLSERAMDKLFGANPRAAVNHTVRCRAAESA